MDVSCDAQVPTWRANPLHPECDTWCEFPVADRPNAVQQWINAAKKDPSMIKVTTNRGIRLVIATRFPKFWCLLMVMEHLHHTIRFYHCCSMSPDEQNVMASQAPWVLMIETDYVWMKPPAAPAAEVLLTFSGLPHYCVSVYQSNLSIQAPRP